MADFAPARRTPQSNRLLSASGESMSLRQGVTARLSMTIAAKPLHMHHCVKTS